MKSDRWSLKALEEGEHVAAQAAGIRHVEGMHPAVVRDGRDRELVLAAPAPVQHGDPGSGPGGDGLHGHLREPGLDQFRPRGVEQRGLEFLAAPPLPVHLSGHRIRITSRRPS